MQAMAQQGVEPDSLTYRILIYAAPKSQGWPRALQLYRFGCLVQATHLDVQCQARVDALRDIMQVEACCCGSCSSLLDMSLLMCLYLNKCHLMLTS